MSLLTAIQDAMVLCGLESPQSAYASGDPTVAQFIALAQVEGDELSRYNDWRKLKVAASITGDGVTTLWPLPADYDRLLSGMTFWSEESPGDQIAGQCRGALGDTGIHCLVTSGRNPGDGEVESPRGR